MISLKSRLVGAACLVSLVLCLGATRRDAPRNIVLMIGDGMGIAQVSAGRTGKGSLAVDDFPTVGLLLTQPWGDDYVTDSGAAATALATGVQTYNHAISVDPDTVAVETVLERAHARRKRTGIVAACSVTHATPACFVSHVPSRKMEFDIAEQISRGPCDIILGGGWGWFLPLGAGGRRTDGVDLVEAMEGRGYRYVSTDSSFRRLDLTSSRRILGLFADNHVGWAQEREPSLAAMTSAALRYLSRSRRGFFLMVEGSQIDWAAHDDDSDQLVVEMEDFDDAVAAVRDFARRHPDTLVIVTADHETGGYSLVDGSLRNHTVEGRFTTTEHTGTMIPLFATGPGAERFSGIHANADVGRELMKLLR